MSTSTSNYGWQMPDPGGSANTWGNTLNATTQAIDAQMAIAAQGGVPIGAITMFGGAAAPTNWLLCDGSSLSTAAPYDKLFAAIGYAFGGSGGNFNLPDLKEVYPLGADMTGNAPLGSGGGQWDYTLDITNVPPHTHAIVDVAHSHGVSQSPHNHNDPGHSHGVTDPTHVHGGGVVSPGGRNTAGGPGQSENLVVTNPASTGISINAAGSGLQSANANISISSSGTGLSTTESAGSGASAEIVMPFLCVNFIIKYS